EDFLPPIGEQGMNAVSLKPSCSFPCKVAVYLRPEHCGDWHWSAQDKAALSSWAKVLQEQRIATEVFPLPDMLASAGKLPDLQAAAARCGADVLLVIQGTANTVSYQNLSAALYLTVVGGFIVPGSHRDAQFKVEGCLFDARTGFVYAGVQADGEGSIVRPCYLIEERDAIEIAKAQAMERFGPELLRRMRAIACREPREQVRAGG